MKKTRVKAHERAGHAVAAHDRKIKPTFKQKLKNFAQQINEKEQKLSEAIGSLAELRHEEPKVYFWEKLPNVEINPKYALEPNEWTPERQPLPNPNQGDPLWTKIADKLLNATGSIPGSTLKVSEETRTGSIEWRFSQAVPSSPTSMRLDKRILAKKRAPIGPGTDFRPYLNDYDWGMTRVKIDLTGTNLAGSIFSHSEMYQMNFTGANLSGCNFHKTGRRIKLPNAVAVGANFSGSNHESFDAKGSVLREADFTEAKITQGDFTEADLSGIKIEKAKFVRCSFDRANFTGVDFSQISLDGPTSIKDAIITPDQFDSLRDFSKSQVRYEPVKFSDTIQTLNITEQQFEFLVISGAIPIYEKQIIRYGAQLPQRVTSNFDPAKHHVPCWAIATIKKTSPEILSSTQEK